MVNTSSIAALDRLRGLGQNMNETQSRVSSGLRVETSTDNAAYWSITTTMGSDKKAMVAVEDALHLGAATVDVAYLGMSEAIDIMSEFKSKLVAAREPGVDRAKINSEMVQLRAEIRSIAENSSFNGQNWLLTEDGNTEPSREIVNAFIRGEDGTVRIGTTTYGPGTFGEPNRLIDETSPGALGILTQPGTMSGWDVGMPNYVFMTGKDAWPSAREMEVDATTSLEEIDTMIDGTEYMMGQMTTAAAKLGSMASQIDNQMEFVRDLLAANDRGIGKLRDADMNKESTRLKALQTQEQLGIQSLTIANSNADSVMSLFR